MSPLPQVEIPLEELETALEQCAVPGFFGDLLVEVQLLPSVRFEIQFHIERRTVTMPAVTKTDIVASPSNERVHKVRSKLGEFRGKFRVECPVSRAKATFRDGHLITFETVETSVARAAQ
jgi:hypothetical protein